MQRQEQKGRVEEWALRHPESALYDKEQGVLLDTASGKRLRVPWDRVFDLEEKTHPETGERYLILVLEDGSRIGLVHPGGVAFTPSTVNSGPIPGLPQAFCLGDFLKLKAQISHHVTAHPHDPVPRECLDLVMISIAILDGAGLVGFEVGDFEKELEDLLEEIEKRK